MHGALPDGTPTSDPASGMHRTALVRKRWLLALLLATALPWLAVLACDLIASYPPTLLGASAVLRNAALLALAVALAVTLGLVVGSGVLTLAVDALRRRLGLPAPSLGALAALTALLSSAAFVVQREEWSVLLVSLAGAALLGALVLPLCVRASESLGRGLELVLAIAAGGLWTWLVATRMQAQGLAIGALVVGVIGALSATLAPARAERLPRRWSFPVAVLGLVVVVFLGDRGPSHRAAPSEAEPPVGKPNVLVFLVDTVRADHTSLQGYDLPTTPTLQRFAAERATEFTQAWTAAPSTMPSVKSLFTSQLASSWGFKGAARNPPPFKAWTLPKAMRDRGYRTAGFSANSLVDKPGYHQGFEEFWGLGGLSAFRGSYLLQEVLAGGDTLRGWSVLAAYQLHKVLGASMVARADDWLTRNGGRPFFLYVHTVDPHWPYHARNYGLEHDGFGPDDETYVYVDFYRDERLKPATSSPGMQEMIARYDDELRFSDDVLAQMLALLERHGVAEDTLVVYCSDHGEAFFEHGEYGHGSQLFTEQTHVPLLFRWPRGLFDVEAPVRVTRPVSLLDLAPTLVELLDLPVAEGDLAGRSLVPLLRDASAEHAPVFSEAFAGRSGILGYREGDLVVHFTVPHRRPALTEARVFDLAADPGQLVPIDPRDSRDPRVAAFMERARAGMQPILEQRRAMARGRPEPGQDDPEEESDVDAQLELLKDLGYVDE